jgi:putative ABC transport system permease protein
MARISFANLLRIYRARLRARAVLVQEGLAILGIAVGVALLFATQVASTSLSRSVQELTRQVIGSSQQFQLDARGPDGVSERLLGEVRGLSGVRSAFPVLEQQANVIGPSGQRAVDLIGTDPGLTNLGGPLLRRFSATQLAGQRAIALPTPLAEAIGASSLQTIKIQIGSTVVKTLLGTTLGEADIRGLVHSPVALAPVAYAQQLAGLQGRITRIFVRPASGHTREVQRELATLANATAMNLEPASFDSTLFATAVAPESQSETLFSAISALVGFMFALNAMLISAPARRTLIQSVQPLGASRLMRVQVLLFDAAVIALLACVLGLALGELLSIAVFHTTPGYLSFAFPVGNDRIVTWQSVGLAVGAGAIAALLGVFWPLRDTLLPQPQKSGRRGPTGRAWRLTAGMACLLLTTLILLFDASAAVVGNVALIIALVCLIPLLFDGLLFLFDHVQRSFNSAATRLALNELRNPHTRVRSLAIATTAALAVLGIVEFQGTQANLAAGLDASARAIDSSADVWVTPSGESNAFATTSFSPHHAAALGHLQGVSELALYRGSFLNWGDRRLWILAPPGPAARSLLQAQLVTGEPSSVAAKVSSGGWAVLSRGLAAERHLRVGQRFTLPSPRPTPLRLAAVSSNLGWPPGAVIMNSVDYARAWGSNDPSAYQIQTSPGTTPAAVRRLVQQTLGPDTGLTVETARQREQRHYALASQGLSRLTQIRLLVLIAAVLAVTAAMGALMWQRRDRVAFLKCSGFSRSVLLRWLLYESAVLLAAGCSIGAVFGIYAQVLGSHFLASVTGFPIVFNIEALAALSSFALVTTVAVAIVVLPGYLVVRVPPRTVSPAY